MLKNPFQIILSLIYPLTDFAVIVLSIMISYKTYRLLGIGQSVVYQKIEIIPIGFLISFVSIAVMNGFGVYKKGSSVLNAEEIRNTIKGATIAYLIFLMILVFGKFNLLRYVIIFSYFISLGLLIIEKTAFYHLHPLSKVLRRVHKRVLIYGAGELGQALFRELVNSPKLNLLPVGFVDDSLEKIDTVYYQNGFQNSHSISVIGTGRDIPRLAQELDIDDVYVAMSNIDNVTLSNIINYLKYNNIKVSFVPNLYNTLIHKIQINQIGQILLIREEDNNVQIPYLYVKRFLDLIFGLVLLVILCPLFLIIFLAVKLDSRGPIFFKQDRI